MAAIGSVPSSGSVSPIGASQRPDPGDLPAQLQPGEQEQIQGLMLKGATSSRDSIAADLAKSPAELIASETSKAQQKRASDESSYNFQIEAAGRNIQTSSDPAFWQWAQQQSIQRKGEVLAADDQAIATVPQREPEIRAKLQGDLGFYNDRIAKLQAGPVTITQREAEAYRPLLARQPPVGGAAGGGQAAYGYSAQSSFIAASAARPPVAGLF